MSLENFGLFFFNILFALVNSMINAFIAPLIVALNGLLSIFITGYDSTIMSILSSVNQLINVVILPGMVWVINLFPPVTFSVCMLFLGLWLLIWSYEVTAGVIIRCLLFVKRVVPFI